MLDTEKKAAFAQAQHARLVAFVSTGIIEGSKAHLTIQEVSDIQIRALLEMAIGSQYLLDCADVKRITDMFDEEAFISKVRLAANSVREDMKKAEKIRAEAMGEVPGQHDRLH